MTAATLANALQSVDPELEIYLHGLRPVEGFDIVEISDRHSEEWLMPKKFIVLADKKG